MNDQRLTPPPDGPSDEEIERFIITNWLEGKPPVTAEWMRAMVKFVRQVLAQWRAQTECDPVKVDALVVAAKNVLIRSHNGYWWDRLEEAMNDFCPSSRSKGRVVEGVACLDTRGNPTQVTFDIAASKIDEVCRELNPANGRVRFAHACVEILDAPEEETK